MATMFHNIVNALVYSDALIVVLFSFIYLFVYLFIYLFIYFLLFFGMCTSKSMFG